MPTDWTDLNKVKIIYCFLIYNLELWIKKKVICHYFDEIILNYF